MQKRVNGEGHRLLSLERPPFKTGHWLWARKLTSKQSLTLTGIKLSINGKTLPSFRESGIWIRAGQRLPTWPVPNKNSGLRGWGQPYWWMTSHMCCYSPLLREWSTYYVTPLGEDFWKLLPGFTQTPPHALVSFNGLFLYSFAIITH